MSRLATVHRHTDARICERREHGGWKVVDNPTNRGVVGLSCDRYDHPQAQL